MTFYPTPSLQWFGSYKLWMGSRETCCDKTNRGLEAIKTGSEWLVFTLRQEYFCPYSRDPKTQKQYEMCKKNQLYILRRLIVYE